jgi:thioredoxin 1
MNHLKRVLLFILLTVSSLSTACSQSTVLTDKSKTIEGSASENMAADKKYKVTFIELGSVRCIPCQQMQSVMKSIGTKYGKEVKIDFHDVWTEAGKPYGVKYAIEAIPTQIFLDESGKEFYRHVGFFPEEELVKILQMKGVKDIKQ